MREFMKLHGLPTQTHLTIREMVKTIWNVELKELDIKFLPGHRPYGAKIAVPCSFRYKAKWLMEDEPKSMVQLGLRLVSPTPTFEQINLVFDHWLVPWKYLGAYDETHSILFVAKGETLDDRT